jgi:hypothetical protein
MGSATAICLRSHRPDQSVCWQAMFPLGSSRCLRHRSAGACAGTMAGLMRQLWRILPAGSGGKRARMVCRLHLLLRASCHQMPIWRCRLQRRISWTMRYPRPSMPMRQCLLKRLRRSIELPTISGSKDARCTGKAAGEKTFLRPYMKAHGVHRILADRAGLSRV